MTNAQATLKTITTYAICVPLAVVLGYMLADPLDYSTFAYAGVLALVLFSPLLLRWHYPLLWFSLNASVVLFFIKGRPDFWLVMVALSLGLSLLERALNSKKRFIRVPQISWPLICMLGVVYLTARLTGGIGLRAFSSDIYGGKKYIFLIMSILSYFAFTAQRIPPGRANLYLALFLLGGVTWVIGDLFPITPPFFQFIFLLFPPSGGLSDEFVVGVTRLPGTASAAEAVVCWMMARYGLRGIFLSGKLWRPVLFALASMMIFLGGYRLAIISYLCIFGLLFFLERLHRTRAMPVFVMAGMLLAVAIIPFASRLPFTFQRALAFLPLNLSEEARTGADNSLQWRIQMWQALLPQVPSHLLLGEGYVITMTDFQMMGAGAFNSVDPGQQGLALAHDFHNGPLSVVLPFGIWGVIALLWLMLAGLRVVYCNFRHGAGSLRTINTYLWVSLLYDSFKFIFLYGALNSGMLTFASTIGFSIALNGGVCRPAPQAVLAQKPTGQPAKILPPARPVFQR